MLDELKLSVPTLISSPHSHDTSFVFVQTVIFVVVGCRWRPLDVEANVAATSRDFLELVCLVSLTQSAIFFYCTPCLASLKMHTTRSPCSIPTSVPGDALDLSLSGSQLSVSRRPASASPGKYFSRSVSMSVAGESRGKRNTLVS